MPIGDYDQEKTLQATSVNDSGATVDKAQPVILRGEDFTGVDGFESGSSQLGWESTSNITVDSGSEMFLSNSLQVASSNNSVSQTLSLQSAVDADGKKILASTKIDNQTGNGSDTVDIFLEDTAGAGGKIASVQLRGDGNIDYRNDNTSTQNIGTWSAGTVIEFRFEMDFTNQQVEIFKNDSSLGTFSIDLSFDFDTGSVSGTAFESDSEVGSDSKTFNETLDWSAFYAQMSMGETFSVTGTLDFDVANFNIS